MIRSAISYGIATAIGSAVGMTIGVVAGMAINEIMSQKVGAVNNTYGPTVDMPPDVDLPSGA